MKKKSCLSAPFIIIIRSYCLRDVGHCCIGKFCSTTTEATHKAHEMNVFIIFDLYFLLGMKTCLFPQVVWVGTTGRTVQSSAPVGREGSATQLLGGASVPLVGWDSPANKVTMNWRLWLLWLISSCWGPMTCQSLLFMISFNILKGNQFY